MMMRKILLINMLMMSVVGHCVAQLYGGANLGRYNQLNPYAYGVGYTVEGETISLQYKLNAPAVKTEMAVYCDSVEVGVQAIDASHNGEGAHTALVDLGSYTAGGTYTIGIRVLGDTTRKVPEQLMGIDEEEGDTVPTCYAFYSPKGVAIDKDPFSPNYGRILTNETYNNVANAGYWSSRGKAGIYAFDAAFRPLNNGNVYNGGLTYASTMLSGNPAYSPYRIVISEDGRIFASMHDDRFNAIVYEVSEDLQTWTPVIAGDHTTDGVLYDAENHYVGSINCAMDVKGSGDNLTLLLLGASKNAYPYQWNNHLVLAEYPLGTAGSIDLPSRADTLGKTFSAYVIPANCDVAYDSEGGYWFKSNRAYLNQSPLVHVNAAGIVDYDANLDQAFLCTLDGVTGNGFNSGAGIYIEGDKLYLGIGQAYSGTGHLVCFHVNRTSANAIRLSVDFEYHLKGISRNLNDFAIDPAGNLYTVGNSNEKIVCLMLPQQGAVETPVDVHIMKEPVATMIEEATHSPRVEKIMENGQVIIIRDGKRYNTIGVRM